MQKLTDGQCNMKNLKDFTFGFIGLGLMGGSLAKAIRENILDVPESSGKIYASDINHVSLDAAEKGKIIDKGFDIKDVDKMLSECDFVYICLYPHKTLEFLIDHKNDFKKGSIITDISGVKTLIFKHINEIENQSFDFIAGHPMAGGEKEGYIHSSGSFFQKRNYIIMPRNGNKAENIKVLKNIITAMGFMRIIETDYKTHDHKIAFTSQLCHVIASALVDSAEDSNITAFGGGSYEDLTRIAMINAPLWTELFLSNKEELLNNIDSFEKSLENLKVAIKKDDANALQTTLERVRTKRMAMSCIDTTL